MLKKAHFIGIGGVGMSATAKLLRESGVEVTGSDEAVYPPISDFLKRERLPYKTPYAASNVPADADLIIIGKNAKLVPESNSEVAEVIHSGKKISSFPEVLADLSKDKKTVVVAGSYGKSSSAALLSHCLETAGLDPSYFIGAIPKSPASSAHLGSGELFVLEGDEYPSSNTDPRSKFLHFRPAHLLITPLAHDHFNVFPTPEDYIKPFRELLALTAGTAVVCAEGPLSGELLSGAQRPVITYGLTSGEYQAGNISWGEKTSFDILRNGSVVVRVETGELGEHSVQNIVGIAALLFSCNILTPEQLRVAVASFKGVVRRLDKKSEKTSVPVFEGFGSSYEKAKSAIAAMKRHFPSRRLLVVFEPYTFAWRNRDAISWYDDVFDGAGKVYILEPAGHGKTNEKEAAMGEILERIQSSKIAAMADVDPQRLLFAIQDDLEQNDAVLMLSSGPLGGLVESLPLIAEQKFPL